MTYSVALPLAVNVQDYFREDWCAPSRAALYATVTDGTS